MNVREAMEAQAAAHEVLIRAFKNIDPRDAFCDMTDQWWYMDRSGIAYANDRDAALWGRAYRLGDGDPILDQPEPAWGSAGIVRVGKSCSPASCGFTAITIDNQDGHGDSIYVLDDAKRIP